MGPRLFSRGNTPGHRPETEPPVVLQWGHDFSAVEIQDCSRLQFSRDPGFNGATTFQPWKCDRPVVLIELYPLLQWGHDFSAVEIKGIGHLGRGIISASMGPRLFSRGNGILVNNDMINSPRFNGATTFQPWKWRPFFALYWCRKMGRFREVGQICHRTLLCANVFTGVFAI